MFKMIDCPVIRFLESKWNVLSKFVNDYIGQLYSYTRSTLFNTIYAKVFQKIK